MLVPLAFWIMLVAALAIAWQAGDRQDREVLVAIFVAAVLTALTDLVLDFTAWRSAVLVIDAALLGVVWRYALVSQRYWPIAFAGLHLAGTLVGAFALVLAGEARSTFALLGSFWSIPALLCMVIGLLADQRQGIANAPGARAHER